MNHNKSPELNDSIWDDPQLDARAPQQCPHCERVLAHPDDLQDNENIDAAGLFQAYRAHRQAHFSWGGDPQSHGDRYGDPYLGNYYDGDKDATGGSSGDVGEDPEEIVGHVFEVTITHEAKTTARVVAPSASRAKEKVKYEEYPDGTDLNDINPEPRITHELHSEAREIKEVERKDDDLAERMAGWPW